MNESEMMDRRGPTVQVILLSLFTCTMADLNRRRACDTDSSQEESAAAAGSVAATAAGPAPKTYSREGTTIAVGVSNLSSISNEESHLVPERVSNATSITPELALMHMIKAMLGTGLLSLPLAFKLAGLWLGLVLLFVIFIICLICMRQVVFASHFICSRYNRETVDYANIMRGAVECGPAWIKKYGYFSKHLINANIFLSQMGFCSVYFVFMADNLRDFFDKNSSVHMSSAVWMLILFIPISLLCSIRRLSDLAPFSLAANVIYICAVAVVLKYFLVNSKPTNSLPPIGRLSDLPLFFGTVMFAFEGVSVIMPIENRMKQPEMFIKWNGVLNSSCIIVLVFYAVIGFYGYLAIGDSVADTVTLNLPNEPFYQVIKLLFVLCVMVSYPIQFYVPLERVEKWITRKIPVEKQTKLIFFARYGLVLLTCAFAESIPHLALFISLIGALCGSLMALIIPPIIDTLVAYAKHELSTTVKLKNSFLIAFGVFGCCTGTYLALERIIGKAHD